MTLLQDTRQDAAFVTMEIRVRGRVQGVGFRPTVWRIARELELAGEVLNDCEGVLVRVRGALAPSRISSSAWRASRRPWRGSTGSKFAPLPALCRLNFGSPRAVRATRTPRSRRTPRSARLVLRKSSIPSSAASTIPSPIARIAGRV